MDIRYHFAYLLLKVCDFHPKQMSEQKTGKMRLCDQMKVGGAGDAESVTRSPTMLVQVEFIEPDNRGTSQAKRNPHLPHTK
jgi:hypothetical protein